MWDIREVWWFPTCPWQGRLSGRWLRVTGAAGHKKVCCQYFLTKSQCETGQVWLGLAPLTRRKPILGCGLSLCCVQPSQTPGMSPTCAGGGGETKRGRCQLFVGAEGAIAGGWLDINPSCDAVIARAGLVTVAQMTSCEILWLSVTQSTQVSQDQHYGSIKPLRPSNQLSAAQI